MRAITVSLIAAAAGAASAIECEDGLHMIVARGTTEKAGPGSMGVLADAVAKQIPGSDVDGLVYPATFTDPYYFDSVRNGTEELREVVEEYIKACPNNKLAVLGYSQGAHVASDVFCGGVAAAQPEDKALPEKQVEKNVVAIVLFGDPTRVADATYNRGTAEHDAIFPRSDVKACENLGDILVSYCDAGDQYCDNGPSKDKNLTVHGQYVNRYGDQVVKFIVDQYKSAEESASTTPSGTATATSTVTTPSASSEPSSTSGSEPSGTSGAASTPSSVDDGAFGLAPSLGLMGLISMVAIALL